MSANSTASRLAALSGLEGAKLAVQAIGAKASGVHAVLLYGAAGAGKRQLADVLAQAWLCTLATGCGDCKACQSAVSGGNVDVHVIDPVGKSSIIRLEAIVPRPPKQGDPPVTPISEFIRVGPLVSRHKVVIVRDADRMNYDAANALLKMLEEPPPYCKFILTTTAIGSLPATILSRCLSIACALPKSSDVDSEIWRLSGGAPFRVAAVESRLEAHSAIDRIASNLGKARVGEALAISESLLALSERAFDKENGARAANVDTLEAFAACVAHHHPERPEWASAIVEAHRRVRGNGAAGLIFDSLIASMLSGTGLASRSGTERE